MATVNADGTVTKGYITGPFGEKIELLNGTTTPTMPNLGLGQDTHLGAYKKTTSTHLTISPTQMGARVYLAELGRFLSVDPVEGGTLNNYVYAQDPVNQKDLSGKAIPFAYALGLAVITVLTVAQARKEVTDNPKSGWAWVGAGLSVAGLGWAGAARSGLKPLFGGATRKPLVYMPPVISKRKAAPRARDFTIQKHVPLVMSPKYMADMERKAVQRAVSRANRNTTHKAIAFKRNPTSYELGDSRYSGMIKYKCFFYTGNAFVEVHYNFGNNMIADYKVKGWVNTNKFHSKASSSC